MFCGFKIVLDVLVAKNKMIILDGFFQSEFKLLFLNLDQLYDWPHHAVSNQCISCFVFVGLKCLLFLYNKNSSARNIDELGDIMAKAAVVSGFLSSQIDT